MQRLPHLKSPPTVSRAARHVRTTISGARSSPRSWSMTAFSISPAGTRRMGQDALSRFSTSVET
jgi:hypothetical protein